jgi:hypothetical protein
VLACIAVLWSPVGAPAGVPGPRRNADECDAGWFAPVATRRRPIFADFSVGFAMARGIFPGGYPRTPCRPILAGCAPTGPEARTRCASRRPQPLPRCDSGRRRLSGRCGPQPARLRRPPRGLIVGRGGLRGAGLRWPLRPWRRIFASDAVVAPHLRFGTGSGTASPWLTVPWRPTSAPYPRDGPVSAHAHPWHRPRFRYPPVARRPLPVHPLFTSRTVVTLRLRHAAASRPGLPCVSRKAI